MKRLLLAQCAVLWLFACSAGEALSHTFVHLFEWTWQDIAKECEDFLGPNKYTAVQISPPNEHRVLLGRPWYERYQPVSYRLTSRSGSRAELTDMIQRCHNAGVKVVDDFLPGKGVFSGGKGKFKGRLADSMNNSKSCRNQLATKSMPSST